MNITWSRCIATCALAALASLGMPIAVAQTPDSNAALQTRVRELEKEQQRLLEETRQKRKEKAVAPVINDEDLARKSEKIEKRAREIEERIAALDVKSKTYFTASTVATSEMRVYHKRLIARLEDCGTRHNPKRGGKSVYGKGYVSIELDHGGNAVTMTIERSSDDELIDNHMLKLIAASSPFGPTPERVHPLDERRYDRLVVITSFEFMRGAKPDKPIEASERCRL